MDRDVRLLSPQPQLGELVEPNDLAMDAAAVSRISTTSAASSALARRGRRSAIASAISATPVRSQLAEVHFVDAWERGARAAPDEVIAVLCDRAGLSRSHPLASGLRDANPKPRRRHRQR